MPRKDTITLSLSTRTLTHTVTYLEDSEERQEAIYFFREHGTLLGFSEDVWNTISEMSTSQAQAYLDSNPVQQEWTSLTLPPRTLVSDEDLRRLRHIPEIRRLSIFPIRGITDAGVEHLKWLHRLEHLVFYSLNATDACLEHVANLSTLLALDMQMAPRISRSTFSEAVKRLPHLKSVWPPFSGTVSKELENLYYR